MPLAETLVVPCSYPLLFLCMLGCANDVDLREHMYLLRMEVVCGLCEVETDNRGSLSEQDHCGQRGDMSPLQLDGRHRI